MEILEELKQIYADQGTPEQSLHYLENAINEFTQLFGNTFMGDTYLLMDTVKTFIKDIQFVDVVDQKEFKLGSYSLEDGIVRIKKGLDEEVIKSVMFHEFLHAIAVHDFYCSGFMQVFETDNYKGLHIFIGTGWNEGFVQILTRMRDRKFSKDYESTHSYPILTGIVEQFCELFGLDEMIDMYFDNDSTFLDEDFNVFSDANSSRFSEFLKKYNIPLDFLSNFDVIKEYEEDISTFKEIDPISRRFLGSDFFKSFYDSVSLSKAENDITEKYIELLVQSKKVSLPELLSKVEHINSIFNREMSLSILEKIIDFITPEMIENDEHLENQERKFIHSYIEFEDMSIKEKLKAYPDIVETLIDDPEDYSPLKDDLLKRIIEKLYEDIPDLGDKKTFPLGIGLVGVINYILENDLPFDELRIEYYYHFGKNGIYKLYKDREERRA